jgi:hypothetical protein
MATDERIVVVYTAVTWIEAMVVRGLLESAGIPSPALGDGNPTDPSLTLQGIEIYSLASQAEEAKRVIAEHLREEAFEGGEDE